MVIGLDIDDTITRHPPFFSWLTRSLLKTGHRVIIITFRQDRDGTVADLEQWNIGYSELVMATTEALIEHGPNQWKAMICRKHRVEVFFEDSPEVLEQIDSSVLCLMPAGNNL